MSISWFAKMTLAKERMTMRKNFGQKAWFYPLPVLIIGTYDENGKPKEALNKQLSFCS